MTLVLDRMAIEEVGANPARLAAAIHLQLGAATGAVPVNDIAHALDIQEIRVEHLSNIEGALIAPPERGAGRILVNNSHPRRQRFTVAHELGHYLSPHHVPTAETGFWCTQSDLSVRPSSDRARHRRQEGEANLFAIELLAPRSRARRFCTGRPDIARILEMVDSLDISREAATRRYVELHREPLAVIFSQNGRVRYTAWAATFPALSIRTGAVMPELPVGPNGLSEVHDADPEDWLAQKGRIALTVQTLHQKENWTTTLLHAPDLEDDQDEPEDAFDRISRS